MKRLIKILLFPLFLLPGLALEKLTLEECYQNAVETYPSFRQKDFIKNAGKLKQDNIEKAWFPKLDLNAQATYQSDVTKVDVNLPGIEIPGTGTKINIPPLDIPSPAKDQYKISLDVNQMIYDGGIISAKSKLEEVSIASDIQSVEIDLYKLRERINQAYFNVLLLQENVKLIDVMKHSIEERIKIMESAVRNGVALQSNLDYLKAELFKLDQKKIEIESGKKTSISALSSLISRPVESKTILTVPEISIDPLKQPSRPEYKLFDLQREKLHSSTDIFDSQRYPKIFGFGQFGYGRPALNMLSNDFNTFYFIGMKLSWNIWDWNESSQEKEILMIKREIVNTSMDVFDKNLRILLEKEMNDVSKYEEMIKKDNMIIDLKSKITKASASQLDNGVIKSADYISDLNEEIQSKINLESHKLLYIQAKINYKTLSGN